MPKSVFYKCTKKDIDEITKKIINILNSGASDALKFETYQGKGREKNDNFRNTYFLKKDEVVKDIIIKNLKSSDISDVQVDERLEQWRNGNLMYIYLMTASLSTDSVKYEKTDVYLKVELVEIKGNKKIVLVISLHEPERSMTRNYQRLK